MPRFGQYVKALNVSMVMLVAAHTLDIAMYQRINRMVGIPDWVFMLGATHMMPGRSFLAPVCFDGDEHDLVSKLQETCQKSNFNTSDVRVLIDGHRYILNKIG